MINTLIRADRAFILRLRNHVLLSILSVGAVVFGSYTAYNLLVDPGEPSSGISAVPAAGDWPMFQRDPMHSGFTPDSSFKPEGDIDWVFGTDGEIVNSPVVAEGAVYLSSGTRSDQTIVALDAVTGTLLWEHPTFSAIDAPFAVAGGLVYVAVRDGRVLALNTSDGTIRWQYQVDGLMFGSPTVFGGIAYVGTWNKAVYALDAATGTLLWSRKVGGRVTSNPVVNDQIVAFNATDNRVYVLDVRTGKQRLELRAAESAGSVVINGEIVYVAGTNGTLSAIDSTRSNYPFEHKIRSLRVNLYAMGFLGTFPIRKGFVWGVRRLNEGFMGTPAVAGGMVYVSSASGKVFKVDESDGKLVWMFDTGSGAAASDSVAVTSDYVMVGDADGKVHVIDNNTGTPVHQFEIDGPINFAPVIANDTLYVATTNGKLYAVK